MQIRIQATEPETETAVEALKKVFDVREVSTFRPNNRTPGSKLGRVYVDAESLGDNARD